MPQNPLGFAYTSFVGMSAYAGETGMIITGRGNRNAQEFRDARKLGAEVLEYWNASDISLDPVNDEERNLFSQATPWPYPHPGERVNYFNPLTKVYYPMADIRPGASWVTAFCNAVHESLEKTGNDGIFLDVAGYRLWAPWVDWENWPIWEKAEWELANIMLVSRLRSENWKKILVNNGDWGKEGGRLGEKFVNGRCIEHHPPNSYQMEAAKRPFGVPNRRRMLVISPQGTALDGWKAVPEVTHLTDAVRYTGPLPPPSVPLSPLPPAP